MVIMRMAGSHGHYAFEPGSALDWFMVLMPMFGLIGLITLATRRARLESTDFKAEIKEKEEFIALITRLDQALAMIKERSTQQLSPVATQEFYHRLDTSITRLKNMELEEIENLWVWFGPKADWDSVTGPDGSDLGSDIFMLIEKVRSQM
jgi:hypothetical protein